MIDTVPAPSGTIPQMKQPKPKGSAVKRWVKIVALLLLIAVALTFLQQLSKNQTVSDLKKQLGLNFLKQQQDKRDMALFTVGEESIYASDLDQEKKMYPSEVTPEIELAIKEKMQEDSIILQEAGKRGLIVLEPSFYNSPSKNYPTRIQQVQVAKNMLFAKELQANQGEGVAIWFMNTEPARIGYDAAKKLAFAKISSLHQKVRSGELTIAEAGKQITDDTSLEQVDKAYKSNAYFKFVIVPNQKVVFEDAADKIIRNTKPGELTDVLVLQDRVGSTPEVKEALYLFAKIGDSTATDPNVLNAWLEEKKKTYAIIN